ncbi:MAG: hypothetical protein HQK95_05290 [Nitrospirae bacterium]|nr:hypothetical protein [Nitrospirota bacterium]
METGFRYRMEHLGDLFVGMVDKVSEAARCSAKGVILTYDIHFLKKKRQGLVSILGARVAALRKTDPEQVVFADKDIRELLIDLDETEKRYEQCVAERQSRLYPSSCSCSCTPQDEPHTHEEAHTHDEPHTHEDQHIYDEHHTHEEEYTHEEGYMREQEIAHDEPHTHEQEHTHDEPHTHEEHTHEEHVEEDHEEGSDRAD